MSNASILASPRWWQRPVDWIAGHQRIFLLAGVGFQLFVLLGMIAFRAAPYWSGETMLLRVVPVDPRDMFRGDYVTLGYEFSRLSALPGYSQYGEQQRRTVYVTLEPEQDGKHWQPTRFSVDRPSAGRFIQGTTIGRDRAEFGIESFYVQEGKGLKYEEAARRHELSAVVSLSPDGHAALRSLQVDDRP